MLPPIEIIFDNDIACAVDTLSGRVETSLPCVQFYVMGVVTLCDRESTQGTGSIQKELFTASLFQRTVTIWSAHVYLTRSSLYDDVSVSMTFHFSIDLPPFYQTLASLTPMSTSATSQKSSLIHPNSART